LDDFDVCAKSMLNDVRIFVAQKTMTSYTFIGRCPQFFREFAFKRG